jgi:hypothetical protein
MVALPDADGQDFIRNERTTRYCGGFVLEGVSDVQLAKERKCTSTVSSGSEQLLMVVFMRVLERA